MITTAAPRTTVAACHDLARTYGSGQAAVVAVHATSCDIVAGDRIAVVGSSGCGKSTLLHLIAGLDAPTAGTVIWPGVGGSPGPRPDVVGVIFQAPSLIPALDVAENVALPLVLAGVPEPDAHRRAVAALTLLHLASLAGKLPEELSGGQAQRVAAARVLAARPRLILADEPTGQLDQASGGQVLDVLLAVADQLDAAVVVTTHDPAVADRMTQRWSMAAGRLDTRTASRVNTPTARA